MTLAHTFANKIPAFMDRKTHGLRCLGSGLLIQLISFYRGIEVGKGCRFNGLPIIRRAPGSEIAIGNYCRFNSSKKSTLMGARPCYLSTVYSGSKIRIRDNCGFTGTIIIAVESVLVGENVTCGFNTIIADSDFKAIDPEERIKRAPGISSPVVLEDNVFLGMNVTVLKGVTIGENSVIAAGSIVSRSLPANVIAAGTPAKVIKEISHP